MTEDMLAELIGDQAYIDALFINKSQKMACGFVHGQNSIDRYEFDIINNKSLLSAVVYAGQANKQQQFSISMINPLGHPEFNEEIDFPLKIQNKFEFVGDVDYQDDSCMWKYLLYPIVDRQFEKTKLVIRIAIKNPQVNYVDQLVQYTIKQLSNRLLNSFSTFKTMVK